MPRSLPIATLMLASALLAGCEQQAGRTENGAQDGATEENAAAGMPAADHGQASPPGQVDGVSIQVVAEEGYRAVLDEHRGRVVLVDFWATWCIPCREEFPYTVAMSDKYAGDGLAVISMSMDDPDEGKQPALEFLREQNANFPNLLSRYGGSPKSMEVFDIEGGALPHYKIYGRDGKLLTKLGGDPFNPIDHDDVEAAVRKALGLEETT